MLRIILLFSSRFPQLNILFVEDNDSKQLIMQEALREAGTQCNLWMVKNGVEALELLKAEKKRFEIYLKDRECGR